MSDTPALTSDRYGVEISGDMDFETWADEFTALLTQKEMCAWGIADMVIYAEAHGGYDGMYAQLLDPRRMSPEGLANRVSLARRFPREKRAFDVGISYYEAARTLSDASAFKLLQQAEDDPDMTRELFRELVRKEKQDPTPDTQKVTLVWDAAIAAFKPSVAPKLWVSDGYKFEVTLREKAA